MPDITMCPDSKCPERNKCFRYMATPNMFGQAYSDFNRVDGESRCDSFEPMPEDHHKQPDA